VLTGNQERPEKSWVFFLWQQGASLTVHRFFAVNTTKGGSAGVNAASNCNLTLGLSDDMDMVLFKGWFFMHFLYHA